MIPLPDDLWPGLFDLLGVIISTTITCLAAGRACRWWDRERRLP